MGLRRRAFLYVTVGERTRAQEDRVYVTLLAKVVSKVCMSWPWVGLKLTEPDSQTANFSARDLSKAGEAEEGSVRATRGGGSSGTASLFMLFLAYFSYILQRVTLKTRHPHVTSNERREHLWIQRGT